MTLIERWMWATISSLAAIAIAVSWIRDEMHMRRIQREHQRRLEEIRRKATR